MEIYRIQKAWYKRIEIHGEIQDMENIQDMKIVLDMEAKHHIHYIVQQPGEEKNCVIGNIKYTLMHFINSC